jgi:hypothetical protein
MTERGRRPANRTERAALARAETQEHPAPADTRDLLRRTEEMRARRRRPAPRGRPSRRRGARLPTAAWVCFGVALLNGIAWGQIIPLFQIPDEPGHVAYAQYIAESGKVPTGSINIKSHFSQEESRLVDAMRWREVHRRKDIRVPGTWSAHQRLERAVDTPADRLSGGGYTTDTNNPPLFTTGCM